MKILINSKWALKRDDWLGNIHYKKGSIATVVEIYISEHSSHVTLQTELGYQVMINVNKLVDKFKGVRK